MNPYLAGTLLGLVLLTTIYFSGRGLGASGGLKYCVVSAVGAVSSQHVTHSAFYSQYFEGGKKPLQNWLVFEILGVLIGGFISGAFSGTARLESRKTSFRIGSTKIDLCLFRRNVVCFRRSACPRMHQRGCALRYGRFINSRICYNDSHFRIRIRICLVFQEKLDLI